MDAINQPLLDVRDLSVAFGDDRSRSIMSRFPIKRGECVALVGESGSGKSVSALSILKLLPYPAASHPSGSDPLQGPRAARRVREREMREIRGNDISIIFQEPMTSLNPLHTIEAQIGEILSLHSGISGAMARARTLELLTQVGIPDPETRLQSYPHQLSGGQRQRVMIAMALANEPDLLIADEPTTALDVTVQAQILALLADIRARLGMSMLFITHDLGIVRRIADIVCVMNSGKIVEQGPVEQVFTAPKHPYTRDLLAAEPKPDPAPPRPNAPVVMSADNLKVWFPIKRGLLRSTVGHIKAVDGVSLAVRKGETLGVVGESGSGKTTLGLALLRLISSDGPIVFLGNNIQGLRFKEMRAVPPRHADRVSGSVRRAQPAHVGRRHRRRRLDRASAVAVARGARGARDQGAEGCRPRSGTRGSAIRTNSPAASASASRSRARWCWSRISSCWTSRPARSTCCSRRRWSICLRELQRKRDLTYMFISHDLRVVASLASHLIVMRHGKVVEEGPAAELFKNPKSDYTRALFAAAFRIEAVPDSGRCDQSSSAGRCQRTEASRRLRIPAFTARNDAECELQPLDRRDLAARRLDARDRLVRVLDRGRHVMRVGVHDGVGVAHDRDMALPEDQVAALQLLGFRCARAPGRGRPAACRCRAGSRCRRRSAKPAPGRSNRCRGCSCRPTDRACRRSVRRPRRNPSPSHRGADMPARQVPAFARDGERAVFARDADARAHRQRLDRRQLDRGAGKRKGPQRRDLVRRRGGGLASAASGSQPT